MRSFPKFLLLAASLFVAMATIAAERERAVSPPERLAPYRAELGQFRRDFGGAHDLPDEKFFLFGMGLRTKLLYKTGALLNAQSGQLIRRWDVSDEIILPAEYSVVLRIKSGGEVRLVEDENGVWVEEAGKRTAIPGTSARVRLPNFAAFKYPAVMRVLHQELLVNVTTNCSGTGLTPARLVA